MTTHNKMLETQIAHQASSSSIPLGRLPSKPKQNPRQQCNAIMRRSGIKLEGPKSTSVEVESEKKRIMIKHHCLTKVSLRRREKLRKKRRPNPFPPKPYCPLSPFHKDLLGLSLNLNLPSFMICFRIAC